MRLIDADDFGNRMYHEAFEKNSNLQKWDSGCWIRYKLFENVLREQPTVEPERKRGEWERHHSRPNVYTDLCWHCSTCGYKAVESWANHFKFCPNCGADMRGGEAE